MPENTKPTASRWQDDGYGPRRDSAGRSLDPWYYDDRRQRGQAVDHGESEFARIWNAIRNKFHGGQ